MFDPHHGEVTEFSMLKYVIPHSVMYTRLSVNLQFPSSI